MTLRVIGWIGWLLIMVAPLSCSSDSSESPTPADVKISCTFVQVEGQPDLGGCLTATNADPDEVKKSCASPNKYAAAACNVTKGTKGCSYVNKNGIPITYWYQGTDWTNDDDATTGMETDCAKVEGDLITK